MRGATPTTEGFSGLLTLIICLVTTASCTFPERSKLYGRCEIELEEMSCPVVDLGRLSPDGQVGDLDTLGCELWVRDPAEGLSEATRRLVSSDLWSLEEDPPGEGDRCEGAGQRVALDPELLAAYSGAALVCPSRVGECPPAVSDLTWSTCEALGDRVTLGDDAVGVASITEAEDLTAVVWYSESAGGSGPRISWLELDGDGSELIIESASPCAQGGCGPIGESPSFVPRTQTTSSGGAVLVADLCSDGRLAVATPEATTCATVDELLERDERGASRALAVSPSVTDDQEITLIWTDEQRLLTTTTVAPLRDAGAEHELWTPPTERLWEEGVFWSLNASYREAPSAACFGDIGAATCFVGWSATSTNPGKRLDERGWLVQEPEGDIEWQSFRSGGLTDAGRLGLGSQVSTEITASPDEGDYRGLIVWRDQTFGVVAAGWSGSPDDSLPEIAGEVLQIGPGHLEGGDPPVWTVSEPALEALDEESFLVLWWQLSGDRGVTLRARRVAVDDSTATLAVSEIGLIGVPGAPEAVLQDPPLLARRSPRPGSVDDRGSILISWAASPSSRQLLHLTPQGDPEADPVGVFSALWSESLDTGDLCDGGCASSAISLGEEGFAVAVASESAVQTTLIHPEEGAVLSDRAEVTLADHMDRLTLWAPPSASLSGRRLMVVYSYQRVNEADRTGYRQLSGLGGLVYPFDEGLNLLTPEQEERLVEPGLDGDGVFRLALQPSFAAGDIPVLTFTELRDHEQRAMVSTEVRVMELSTWDSDDLSEALDLRAMDVPTAPLSGWIPEQIEALDAPCPEISVFSDDRPCLLVSYSVLDVASGAVDSTQNVDPLGGLAVGQLGGDTAWALPGVELFDQLMLIPGGLIEGAAADDGAREVLAAYGSIDPRPGEPLSVEAFKYSGTRELTVSSVDVQWLDVVGAGLGESWDTTELHVDGQVDGVGGALWVRQRDDGRPQELEGALGLRRAELLFTEVDVDLSPTSRALLVDRWVEGITEESSVLRGGLSAYHSAAVLQLEEGRYLVVWTQPAEGEEQSDGARAYAQQLRCR